jgi:hypothetical protein
VGIPTALAAHLKRVRVDAAHVVCVGNLAAFLQVDASRRRQADGPGQGGL